MALLIDPPEGWMYGFPKEIPSDRLGDYKVWLVEEGYPKEKIEIKGEGHFRCRFIGDLVDLERLKI